MPDVEANGSELVVRDRPSPGTLTPGPFRLVMLHLTRKVNLVTVLLTPLVA